MNPEPSERLSERGPGPGPGTPGCWRGMKRRKNSWISSSSMPGICGSALVRRTACVVLMLTTALPCSSTRRVKSGSTCVCASTVIQLAAELPAGEARRRGSAVLDAPAAGGLPRLHHVAAHRADGELREHELLDRVAARIERDGLQQHAAVHVGVELVAVAQIVLRREHHRLAVEAGDAVVLAEADVIVARERAHALGQQRREIALGGAAIDLDHPALGQV